MSPLPAWDELRSRFRALESGIYLNTAAEGLWPDDYGSGTARYLVAKARGAAGRPELSRIESETRASFARLLHIEPETVAFSSSTTRGLNVALDTIAPQPGDNVVMFDSEFPAAILAGHRLRERGVDVRLVPALGRDVSEHDLVARIDERTVAVVVSAVSFITGRAADIHNLRRLLGGAGPKLIVDGIQAVGVRELPLDDIDVLVTGTYKWLLGPHGLAAMYINPRTMADRNPLYSGWKGIEDPFAPDRLTTHHLHSDARRFEDGMPNYLGISALHEALRFLEGIGFDHRMERTRMLTQVLAELLDERGIPYGPVDPQRRAGIIVISAPDSEKVAGELAEHGIQVWGREGVLRVSPYFYNTPDELERLVSAIQPLMTRTASKPDEPGDRT